MMYKWLEEGSRRKWSVVLVKQPNQSCMIMLTRRQSYSNSNFIQLLPPATELYVIVVRVVHKQTGALQFIAVLLSYHFNCQLLKSSPKCSSWNQTQNVMCTQG